MWTNERERRRDGEVGGRGVKTYDTRGGEGERESLEDAEGRGGNKTGKGEKREIEYNRKGMHVFILFL